MTREYWRLGAADAPPARAPLIGQAKRDRELRRAALDPARTRMLLCIKDLTLEVDGERVELRAGLSRVSTGWKGHARMTDEAFIEHFEPVHWKPEIRRRIANGEVRLDDVETRTATDRS